MTEQLEKCQKCGYEGVMIKDTFEEEAAEFDELILKHSCPKCRNITADILNRLLIFSSTLSKMDFQETIRLKLEVPEKPAILAQEKWLKCLLKKFRILR